MSTKTKLFIFLSCLSLLLGGCGDLLKTDVKKKELSASQFQVQCSLDLDKFSDILHERIDSQINCLRENLNLFIRVVKSEKPGYLSRVQLEEYLKRYRPDVTSDMIRALKSVFDLGHLITGEDADYISGETVKKVLDFALVFNEQAALHYGPVFDNKNPVSYSLHMNSRERVSTATKKIIEGLRKIYNPIRGGQTHKINIIQLLESFTTEVTRPEIEKAKKLLFAKRIILGGEGEILTHHELERLLLNFDQLLLITLDAVRFKYIVLSQDSLLQLLKRDTNDLFNIINQGALGNRDQEVLASVPQVIEAAKLFIDSSDLDLDQYKTLITEAKKIVMKGGGEVIKGIELKNFFDHAKSLLQTGTVFHRIYAKFAKELNAPGPANIDFEEYRHTYPEHQKELDQFERIVKNYRFMKGAIKLNDQDENSWLSFKTSFYTREYRRNPNGMVEIAMLEYGLKLLLGVYGSKSPNPDAVGGVSINKDQMRALMLKFENELIDMGLIRPLTAVGNADNISLLGTLFQYQSDKNGVMDVNEATEFGVSLLGALNISEDIFGFIKSSGCPMDEFNRVEPQCFRATFWKGMCSKFRNYFPLMSRYLNFPDRCEDISNDPFQSLVLDKAILAARSCNQYTDGNKEEIPYEEGDMMTIMLALMHAETTVLRWDKNGNNFMDADEVDKAYEIYSPALDGFLEGKNPIIKKFKKQIYQYMIKYEKIPDEKDFGSLWNFVKFLLSFNKKANASRKTIVSVLVVIGEQNRLLQTSPQFNCNLLRDPLNIPRTVEDSFKGWMKQKSTLTPSTHHELTRTKKYLDSLGPEMIEGLKDDLYLFADDFRWARVKSVDEIRQPQLKEVLVKIFADKLQMAEIRSLIPEGSDLHKVAFAVSSLVVN